ncbi:MAG: DUF2808 domain-containing protein [Gemmatimonadaceae bacterium]|nr:DUF2808 domain-containing protein [Gloeobacterales cyanobacterium ES-bin-141]
MRPTSLHLSVLLILILASVPIPAQAQSGYVLFGGEKDPDNTLRYTLRNNRAKARSNQLDLEIKPHNVAISEVQLSYPYFFDNSFDLNSIQVINERTGETLPVEKMETEEVDAKERTLTIVMQTPIQADVPLRIRMQNFTNPRNSGLFKMQARYLGTEPNPLYRYAGSWYISFN